MHKPSLALFALLAVASAALAEAPPPVLKHSDVVFMYAADEASYKAYGATFVAWGGANTAAQVKRHRDLGIRCTGSMWCLTAGAENLAKDPALHDAVAKDIEGKPIEVPWLFDHVYQGQKTWFGCTNHPAFRAQAEWFDGFEPADVGPIEAPATVLVTARRKGSGGPIVLHVVNRDYDAQARKIRPAKDVTLTGPAVLAGAKRLLSYDAEPQTPKVSTEGDRTRITLPELRAWTLVVIE